MKIGILAKRAGKAAADNSPALLTGLGAAGVLTAVFLTGKASFKAAQILALAQEEKNLEVGEVVEMEFKEKAELVWKHYVPAAGFTLLSVACMVAANHVGTRRAAAMASAYKIAQKGFEEYKDKVVEKLGENKEQKLRDELAQDRVTRNPPSKSTMIVTGTGEHLCKDEWSGRYFECEIETIKAAVNDINFQIIHQDYASLSDLYDLLQLPHTKESDEVGWNNEKKLEVSYSYTSDDKGRPCLAIDFATIPVRGYGSYY